MQQHQRKVITSGIWLKLMQTPQTHPPKSGIIVKYDVETLRIRQGGRNVRNRSPPGRRNKQRRNWIHMDATARRNADGTPKSMHSTKTKTTIHKWEGETGKWTLIKDGLK